jgi:hypothetical protein
MSRTLSISSSFGFLLRNRAPEKIPVCSEGLGGSEGQAQSPCLACSGQRGIPEDSELLQQCKSGVVLICCRWLRTVPNHGARAGAPCKLSSPGAQGSVIPLSSLSGPDFFALQGALSLLSAGGRRKLVSFLFFFACASLCSVSLSLTSRSPPRARL